MDKATTCRRKEVKIEENCAMKSTDVVAMVGRVIERVIKYIARA
jgi:hypothetical protein